jgi:hypothetical protein
VIFGLTLAVIGLVLAVFPRPLVLVATRYRISMPGRATPDVVRAARIGAVIVMAAGFVIALA